MTTTFGYTIFYVPDVGAALNFYTQAFGISQKFVTPENDYGELETGATTLAFASIGLAASNLDSAGGFAPIDPASLPVGASVTLITDDAAKAVDQAEKAGARRYVEPKKKPWGQTVAYVVDPAGILVELATAVEPVIPDEP